MERIVVLLFGLGLALVIGAAGWLFGPKQVLAFFGAVFVLMLASGVTMLWMVLGEEV